MQPQLQRKNEFQACPGPKNRRSCQVCDASYEQRIVVEDEDFVRELVVEALRESGLEVMQAGNSEQAMALLDTGLRFALLVTDVGLPGLNGR